MQHATNLNRGNNDADEDEPVRESKFLCYSSTGINIFSILVMG